MMMMMMMIMMMMMMMMMMVMVMMMMMMVMIPPTRLSSVSWSCSPLATPYRAATWLFRRLFRR